MSKIVIFTDLHYGEDISGKQKEGINTYGSTAHLLEELQKDIREISPECIINLWDLVFGSTKEKKLEWYQEIKKKFLDILPVNIFHMLWNHEFFIATKEEVEEIIWDMQRRAFIGWNTKHIMLDIALSENNLFELPSESIEWLERELEFYGDVIVYCHFPITEEQENVSYVFGEHRHRAFLENSAKIRELIKWTNCKYWISGHTHFHYQTEIDRIQHVTLPSFSEDNNGKPNSQYAIFDTDTLSLEIKTIR